MAISTPTNHLSDEDFAAAQAFLTTLRSGRPVLIVEK